MRKIVIIALLILTSMTANAQFQTQPCDKGSGHFQNPIFSGDYPDPSLLRNGDDYFIV